MKLQIFILLLVFKGGLAHAGPGDPEPIRDEANKIGNFKKSDIKGQRGGEYFEHEQIVDKIELSNTVVFPKGTIFGGGDKAGWVIRTPNGFKYRGGEFLSGFSARPYDSRAFPGESVSKYDQYVDFIIHDKKIRLKVKKSSKVNFDISAILAEDTKLSSRDSDADTVGYENLIAKKNTSVHFYQTPNTSHGKSRLRSLTLAAPYTFNGLVVPANSEVTFTWLGVLDSVRVDAPHKFGNISIPKNSTINFKLAPIYELKR